MNEVRNIVIGFQLGRKTSQICYYDRKLQEPVSLATKVGSTLFEFPTTLCRRENNDSWHFGLEAEYFGQHADGVYIENLFEINETGKRVTISGEVYEPWQLLAVFLKESLKMLGVQDMEKAISSLMITTESLNTCLVENLKKSLDSLGLKKDCCRIQNYGESFYYYAFYQKPELYLKKVALMKFEGSKLHFQTLQIQKNTKPMLVTLSEKQEFVLGDTPEQWDQDLYQALYNLMNIDEYSSAYLIGDGFDRSWAVNSLPRLVKCARRVFSGNNLFVKGACYAAKEKTEERRLKEYLYVGEDLVRTNVGMEMIVHGMNGYYPLIKAGENWYEAEHSCDFILDEKTELNFLSSPMEGGEKKVLAMELPELPDRPNRTTRLHLKIWAESAKQCRVKVTDMGFGEMFPATKKSWTDTLEI